jgi:hypothetical protein
MKMNVLFVSAQGLDVDVNFITKSNRRGVENPAMRQE